MNRRLGFLVLVVLLALAACSGGPTSEKGRRAWCDGALEGAASVGDQTPVDLAGFTTIDECVDLDYPRDPDQDSGPVPGIVYTFSRDRSDSFNYCLGYAWGRGRDESALVKCVDRWKANQ